MSFAQPSPLNGPKQTDLGWHALVGATVVTSPGESIENATVVLRDGVIVSVRPDADPPAGARVWDVAGLMIYPGLIDAHVPVEAPRPDAGLAGSHWNPVVMPQRSVLDGAGLSENDRESFRKMGFAIAAIAPKDGVFRGSGAVVLLAEPGDASSSQRGNVLTARSYQEIAFERGSFGAGGYPGSQMGAIALIRQTLADAIWRDESFASNEKSGAAAPLPAADALDALLPGDDRLPVLWNTGNELEALRAMKIAQEFGIDSVLLGSGMEFRRLGAVVGDGAPIILPIDFQKAPKVESEAEAEAVSLRSLMTWEQAPTNPRRLVDAGATIALTTDKLKKRSDFAKNLRTAIKHGLTDEAALTALTTAPASILGINDRAGTIEPGKLANLVVVDGSLFDKDATIRDVWVAGVRHEINKAEDHRFVGAWDATFGEGDDAIGALLTIGDDETITLAIDEIEVKARSVRIDGARLSFLTDGDEFDVPGVFTLTASMRDGSFFGVFTDPFGERTPWQAVRTDEKDNDSAEGEKSEDEADEHSDIPEDLVTPLGAYGLSASHDSAPATVAITGATMWTAGEDGIIEDSALLISDGEIIYAGPGAGAPRLAADLTIDATGKHLTPGLIDCHSHTGISGGVNEGTQAVTSEVRIFDVINPDAIGFYRQLAGGLTAMNQLHGSANPIGGQNSVLKLRWGVDRPDDMRFEGAIGGIKFALGENVKQSNWGDSKTTRYPQTRMGVETIMRDRFIAAREYASAMVASKKSGAAPVRRDLELEALAEILAGERLIHCHSYRQDEILMLCRVAEEFGFTIGTFQHVLEGYKVAEAIKENALGGSTFSDWWAYKFEVIDAIPHNGAIMHDAGVPVSFNSDSNELARRLNTEAGKAVKYGGLTREEAIQFVTLNPAKQLMIDDRVGSLEAGKDADFVIWSGDPLSTLSRCESTWVDGIERFSLEMDAKLRLEAQQERTRLLQKLLASKSKKGKGATGAEEAPAGDEMIDSPPPTEAELEYEAWAFDVIRAGGSLDDHLCGSCGDRFKSHNH